MTIRYNKRNKFTTISPPFNKSKIIKIDLSKERLSKDTKTDIKNINLKDIDLDDFKNSDMNDLIALLMKELVSKAKEEI